MFTAYAGPSTNFELKMVRRSEADRLNALDNARTTTPTTTTTATAPEVPGMTEEEFNGIQFWNDPDQFKNWKNYF